MKKFNKGFTLIELLVVIAIIGILSSIVLASLSSARTKGTDAAIKADLSNMRAQAELYSSNWNNYGANSALYTTCPTAATASTTAGLFGATTANYGLLDMIASAKNKLATGALTCSLAANGTSWAIVAPISSGNWCVDSTGASKATSTAGATGVCN